MHTQLYSWNAQFLDDLMENFGSRIPVFRADLQGIIAAFDCCAKLLTL